MLLLLLIIVGDVQRGQVYSVDDVISQHSSSSALKGTVAPVMKMMVNGCAVQATRGLQSIFCWVLTDLHWLT